MRKTVFTVCGKVYIVTNCPREEVSEFVCDFVKNRTEKFIFIIYQLEKKDIVLMHFKVLDNETDFESAIQLVQQDILNGEVCADDVNLQKALNDPQATTAKFLLDFIAL